MKPNRSPRRILTPISVLLLTMPLVAQATPAPLPPPLPAPSYPPPPPRYQGGPPPFAYPFQQAPEPAPAVATPAEAGDGVYRTFSVTASVGPGALIGPGEKQMALSYQLLRLGVGIDRNLQAVFGYESTGTDSVNPATDEDSWLKQDIWSLGLQAHLTSRLYFRGIMGLGYVSETTDTEEFSGGRGITVGAGLGYEFLQLRHAALAVDLHGSYTHYARESWKTTGVQLAVSFF